MDIDNDTVFFLINAALLYSAKPSTAVIFQFK